MSEPTPPNDDNATPEELAEINRLALKLADDGEIIVRALIEQIKRAEAGLSLADDQPPIP